MAQPQQRIGFQNIQIFRTQSLGIGSYGAVYKAQCDDLLCAAKIIHPTLVDFTLLVTQGRKHRLPISRFEQECQFLSSVKHPNVVQYLGTYQDPEIGLPVLLMELMDESLTSFLEHSQLKLPYHLEVTISHDIALALSFLHSNGIIHRDLSSNNVLMIGNSRAKVTDFGMAKLASENPHATGISLTQTPGADVYMPPEATRIPPLYTDKIDCFSYGVLGIQIMTRQFPTPIDRFKEVRIHDPQFPSGSIEVRVPEVERRQEHISLIAQAHPLLEVALDCLKDKDGERPSAREVCGRLTALKQAPQFTQSVRQQAILQQSAADEVAMGELQQELQAQSHNVDTGGKEIAANSVFHTSKFHVAKDSEMRSPTKENEPTGFQGVSLQEMGGSNQIEQKLKRAEVLSGETKGTFKMEFKWREGKKALCQIYKGSDAVAQDNIVYLRPGGTRQVHGYNSTTDDWFQLPHCPHEYFTLALVDNLLTAIGGVKAGQNTSTLLSLMASDHDKKWVEHFPPMPMKRRRTCAVSSGTVLIVIGGQGEKRLELTTLVMNVSTMQWMIAASLPEPLYSASATICDGRIYVMGAYNRSTESVFTCSLSALLESCQRCSVLASMQSVSLSVGIWSKVSDLPVSLSTCVTFHGQVLAIGGEYSDYNTETAIRMYDSTTNSWSIISHMATPRSWCSAAVLPGNRLMVVGGRTTIGKSKSCVVESTEIAYL